MEEGWACKRWRDMTARERCKFALCCLAAAAVFAALLLVDAI